MSSWLLTLASANLKSLKQFLQAIINTSCLRGVGHQNDQEETEAVEIPSI